MPQIHTNPPGLVNKRFTVGINAKQPTVAPQLKLDLVLDSIVANKTLRIAVYDRDLHIRTALGREEVPPGKDGRPDFRRFSTSGLVLEEKFWTPPMVDEPGAPCGVLMQRDIILLLKTVTTKDGRKHHYPCLKEPSTLPGKTLTGFEHQDRPYSVDLLLWDDFDEAKDSTFRVSGRPPYTRVGQLGYSRRAFDSTGDRQPRSLYIRILLLQQAGNLKPGTVILSNACLEHITTTAAHAKRGLLLDDSARPRKRLIGGTGGTPEPSAEVGKRILDDDLTGLWYPAELDPKKTYPPMFLHLNQAGHQRVGWFGPPETFGLTKGPDGASRVPPAIPGLPRRDSNVVHGALATRKVQGLGIDTEIVWRTSPIGVKDEDPSPYWTASDVARGAIKVISRNVIAVRFGDDPAPFVTFNRIHKNSRRAHEEVRQFNFAYADRLPRGVPGRALSQVDFHVPDLVWDDRVRSVLNDKMRESIDKFWAGRQGLVSDHRGAQRAGALGASNVLDGVVSSGAVPEALRGELIDRLHEGLLKVTYKTRKIVGGDINTLKFEDDPDGTTRTVHEWLMMMVEFEIGDDKNGELDPSVPIAARYNARVSRGFKAAHFAPHGDFEYELEFIAKGGEGAPKGVAFQAGGFGLHITKFKYRADGKTKDPIGTTKNSSIAKFPGVDVGPLVGGYFSVSGGLGVSPKFEKAHPNGKRRWKLEKETGDPEKPSSATFRTAADLTIDDFDGMTFRMVVLAGPALKIAGFGPSLGKSFLIQFYFPEKPHLHLASTVSEAPELLGTPDSVADVEMPEAFLGTISMTFGRVAKRFISQKEFEPEVEEPTPEPKLVDEKVERLKDVTVSFRHDSAVVEEYGIRLIDHHLATFRALVEAPGSMKFAGYASPEGTADANKALSERRALRVRDEVVAAVGVSGGKVIPKEKTPKLIGLGEEPSKREKPEGGGLKDPEALPAGERAQHVREQEGEYRRWRKVELWTSGFLVVRLMAKGGTPPK